MVGGYSGDTVCKLRLDKGAAFKIWPYFTDCPFNVKLKHINDSAAVVLH